MRVLVLLVVGVCLGAGALLAPAADASPCVPDVGSCAGPIVCGLLFEGCGPCWPECPPP